MIYLLLNADGSIKSVAQRGGDFVLLPGERLQPLEQRWEEYLARLTLSCNGVSGQTVFARVGSGGLTVQVSCPGRLAVELRVNELTVGVPLENGKGELRLSTAQAGTFTIQPADGSEFARCGSAILTVEVRDEA
jgi:hypothetical protein